MTGLELAEAAETLEGVPFRLHGRDPATGLDCIGVLAASLAACGCPPPFPSGYRLRTRTLPELGGMARACGFALHEGVCKPGDILLVKAGPAQFHFLLAVRGGRFVHAHAGLKRVICSNGPPAWPIVHHWRLATPH
jgi:cell wall-associated NlpC family hydrolase